MSYNGWSNYETWNVALWLDNDGYDSMLREMARDAKDEYSLSKSIEDMIDEMTPDLGANMFSDMLNAALREVNYYEIAEHYWAERESEDTDDDRI